jgi:anti-sigma-K factor RskA
MNDETVQQKERMSPYARARQEKKEQAEGEQFWKRITTAGTFAIVSAVAMAVEVFLKTILKRE